VRTRRKKEHERRMSGTKRVSKHPQRVPARVLSDPNANEALSVRRSEWETELVRK
jgi:hypothetical protein